MISVRLSLSELLNHDPCEEGVALFAAIAGDADEIRIEEWTPLHTVWIRVAYLQYAIWLEHFGLIPRASLVGADLSGADLRDTDLSGANLRSANLRAVDLRRADLYYADLRDANMRGADMRGADLRGADLRGADLSNANLSGAKRHDAPDGWVSVGGYLRRAT